MQLNTETINNKNRLGARKDDAKAAPVLGSPQGLQKINKAGLTAKNPREGRKEELTAKGLRERELRTTPQAIELTTKQRGYTRH